jgi:hypothetical protein
VEQQIGEEAIEFNQNPRSEGHPQGSYYWRSAEEFNKMIHGSPEIKN